MKGNQVWPAGVCVAGRGLMVMGWWSCRWSGVGVGSQHIALRHTWKFLHPAHQHPPPPQAPPVTCSATHLKGGGMTKPEIQINISPEGEFALWKTLALLTEGKGRTRQVRRSRQTGDDRLVSVFTAPRIRRPVSASCRSSVR
ncbi:hypothetical protein E2C01_026383 [Portunus trituberculatus]|uniref:Uncharacterized protein n=1 Tax=Portunus trituberculatus TaxID=210409 RepID=A0A5B7EKS4_PORTR|nr:hypothetical protein [Portunus trituberculatus]